MTNKMAKEILYRIEFEGAESELKKLVEIRDELDKIAVEKIKLDKADKEGAERNKLQAEELRKIYRQEQQAIKDKAKEQKAVAGSLEQLRLEAKRLGKELEKTWAVGTPEFKKAAASLEEVNRKIRNADKSAGNFKSNIGNYAGSIGDAFQGVGINVGSLTSSLGAATAATGPLGIGLAALVGGAQLFGKAITVTDDLSDKFAVTISKAKAATTVFFTSLATGDFSNFITNIRTAIDEGERYAKILDRLEDEQRALNIQDAAARVQVLALQKQLRNVNLTNTERIEIGRQILKIEDENAKKRVKLSKESLDNELKNVATLKGINQERLFEIIKNYDAYEKQIGFVEKLQDAEKRLSQERAKSGGGASGFEVADQAEVRRLTALVESLRRSTAGYSAEIIALGKVSNEERDKIAKAAIEFYTQQASFDDATMRTETRLNSLIAAENKTTETRIALAGKATEAIKEQKRALDQMIDSLGLYARALQPKGAQSPGVGGLRSGAGTPNLPTAPTQDEQDELNAKAGVDIGASIQAASQFVSIWADAYQQKEQALKAALDSGLITEKKYQKESEKLAKKQANIQRILAVSQLTADFARTLSALGLGAANTAKVGFPANIPLLIAFAAQAVGIISNLKSIKFAEGGLIAGGKPHSQGGTKFVGSDGSAFEAEQGEYIAVVNKHDTKRIGSLSALNSLHGKSFYNQPSMSYFAQGGIFNPATSGFNINSDMIRQIVSQIGTIPVVLNTNKIEESNKKQRKVETIGSL